MSTDTGYVKLNQIRRKREEDRMPCQVSRCISKEGCIFLRLAGRRPAKVLVQICVPGNEEKIKEILA